MLLMIFFIKKRSTLRVGGQSRSLLYIMICYDFILYKKETE